MLKFLKTCSLFSLFFHVLFSLDLIHVNVWWLSLGQCCHWCSVAQACLTMWPHGLQDARLPYPSPSPRACSNSLPLSQWCHPTISSSVIPFSPCLQSFPASWSFPESWLFASAQSILARSLSFSISPSNEYSGLIPIRIGWFDLLAVQGILKNLLQHQNLKASILWHSAFFIVQVSHPYMTTGKTIALSRWTFVGKVISLLFIFFIFFYN